MSEDGKFSHEQTPTISTIVLHQRYNVHPYMYRGVHVPTCTCTCTYMCCTCTCMCVHTIILLMCCTKHFSLLLPLTATQNVLSLLPQPSVYSINVSNCNGRYTGMSLSLSPCACMHTLKLINTLFLLSCTKQEHSFSPSLPDRHTCSSSEASRTLQCRCSGMLRLN